MEQLLILTDYLKPEIEGIKNFFNYNLLMSLGLGLIAGSIAYLVYKWAYRPSLIDMLGKKARKRAQSPAVKDAFNRWVDDAEERLQRGGVTGLKGWQFVLIIIGICVGSLVVGIFIFKNIVAAIFLLVSTVLLVDQYIMFKERSVREQMASQLAMAVRVFAATFASNPQVEKGIIAVANACPNPLGKVFKKAEKMIRARIPLDAVLLEMARGMNFDYGLMFVQLLKQVRNNTLILPLFHEMVSRITAREILVRENRVQVDGERMLSLIMVAAPLPSYYLIQFLVPEAHDFLSGTFFGKLIVCMIFLSAITWAVMSRITERVDA